MSGYEDLELLRFEIDQVDEDIAKLAGKRASLARRVGRVKADRGIVARDDAREDLVVRRFAERAADAGYPSGEAHHISRELIRVCRGIVEREVDRSTC